MSSSAQPATPVRASSMKSCEPQRGQPCGLQLLDGGGHRPRRWPDQQLRAAAHAAIAAHGGAHLAGIERPRVARRRAAGWRRSVVHGVDHLAHPGQHARAAILVEAGNDLGHRQAHPGQQALQAPPARRARDGRRRETVACPAPARRRSPPARRTVPARPGCRAGRSSPCRTGPAARRAAARADRGANVSSAKPSTSAARRRWARMRASVSSTASRRVSRPLLPGLSTCPTSPIARLTESSSPSSSTDLPASAPCVCI